MKDLEPLDLILAFVIAFIISAGCFCIHEKEVTKREAARNFQLPASLIPR